MMAGNHHHSHYHLVRMNQALALKSPARGERGFLGFMGEPVMARGERHHTTRLRLSSLTART